MEEANAESLSDLFECGWQLFESIEHSEESVTSEKYQDEVKRCKEILIRCTHMVNTLTLFSRNEQLEEISTGNLRFLLLPAFLGELELKSTRKERKDALKNSMIYFTDFLKRGKEYKFASKNVAKYLCHEKKENSKNIAESREEKISRFKEVKSVNAKIEKMKKRLVQQPGTIDDEMTREYHLDWLTLWVNKAVENITFNKREVDLLEMMEARKDSIEPAKPAPDRPVMKPILITRDMIQKQVFGAGYRSLPTMTEEEYFQKELREGKIVMDYNPQANVDNGNAENKSDSDEDIDNEEKLKKARDWDEWRDTHRRGEGNKERNG